jgi:hypothetical protein
LQFVYNLFLLSQQCNSSKSIIPGAASHSSSHHSISPSNQQQQFQSVVRPSVHIARPLLPPTIATLATLAALGQQQQTTPQMSTPNSMNMNPLMASYWYHVMTGGAGTNAAAFQPPTQNFTCVLCNVRAGSSLELQQHLLSHVTDRPHVCHQCDAAFTTVNSLHAHMQTHNL